MTLTGYNGAFLVVALCVLPAVKMARSEARADLSGTPAVRPGGSVSISSHRITRDLGE